MPSFLDLMTQRTLGSLKAQLVALCQANGLPVTSWIPGGPTERWLDLTSRMIGAVLFGVTTQAVRGFFLDYATDPGDVDAFGNPDLSADQTPRPGFLSALGQGWYNTTRRGQTTAECAVTVTNTGSAPTSPFAPGDLSFTTQAPEPSKFDGGRPTYRNDVAPSIYTGIGGTLTLNPGASATLPVIAEQKGAYGSASTDSLICVTQSFGPLSVVSSTQAIGQEREDASLYRARCRLSASALAPGGPGSKYLYAMNTARDGTPLQRFDGSGPVTISSGVVSPSSATFVVTMFVAGPSGAVDSIDVSSANLNINGLVQGAITAPLGVVPDGITIGPTTNDPHILPSGTPGCASATNLPINVTWIVKIRARDVPGGASPGSSYTNLTTQVVGSGSLPASTIHVLSTSGFPSSGMIYLGPNATAVTYSSVTGGATPSFNGCAGGSGALTPGEVVAGSSNPAGIAALFLAVTNALSADILGAGIGGKDQVPGVGGVIYTKDLLADVRDAVPRFYDPDVTTPSPITGSTAIGLTSSVGYIGVLGTSNGTITVAS